MSITYDPIVAGERITHLLNDDLIQQIFRERKLLYFEQWLKSEDPSERERIFAEARAFGALDSALQAVVNAGLHEKAQPELERRSQ